MSNKLTYAIPAAGLLAIGTMLTVLEVDFLRQAEEQSLWLQTPLFFSQCMVEAGGWLEWAGAFLTQLFATPLGDTSSPLPGVVALCLLWGVLMAAVKGAFRVPSQWVPLLLIPVCMLLLTCVDLGYWIYYLKLRGHLFVATLGTVLAVLLVWLYRLLPDRSRLRTLFVAATAATGYPLLGCYGLLATALMGVVAWRIGGRRRTLCIADSAVALLCIVAVPLVCYRYVYHETPIENIYWTALPVFRLHKQSLPAYYIPYAVLAACLFALAGLTPRRPVAARRHGMRQVAVQGVLLVATAVATWHFWYRDDNFHRELMMSQRIDRQDWQGVVDVIRDAKDEPTTAMSMMKDLALFHLGRLGDDMYRLPNGARPAAAPFAVHLVHTEGKMLYLNYGLVNFCYRWCIEDGVEYGWNAAGLKLMVKCALLNGEFATAQKYISLLKKTTVHRVWGRRYEACIRNPRLMADDPELRFLVHLMRQGDDYLSSDNGNMEDFLKEHLAFSQSDDPLYSELSLVAAMQTGHMHLFWQRFYHYTELHRGRPAPIHYQEAACLFGHLGDEVDVSQMPFAPQVVGDYEAFMAAVYQHQKGRSEAELRELLRPRFGHTFYYAHFFGNHQADAGQEGGNG